MTELLIIFQLHTDKKTIIVSDIIIPVPKWLSNTDLINLIKTSLAAIDWAGAILNIINLNTINSPKVEIVKDYTPKPECTSFWPRKEKGYGSNGFSKGEGRPSVRYGGHSARPNREDNRPQSDDYRSKREDNREWFHKSSGGGYPHRPTWGWFHGKWWGRASRPSRSR